MVIVWLVLGFAAVVAAWRYFEWKRDRERRLALASLAQRLGLQFDPDSKPGHDERHPQFEIFQQGRSRVARNTMTGTVDLFGRPCEVRCGDFQYKSIGGDRTSSTRTIDLSYFIAHAPWNAPRLLIRTKGPSDRIDSAVGFDGINFESAEFSRAFYVASSDRRFAYDVLHPRMMEYLLAERPPMLVLDGDALCLGNGERLWITPAFERQLAFVRRFAELWPRHLTKKLEN